MKDHYKVAASAIVLTMLNGCDRPDAHHFPPLPESTSAIGEYKTVAEARADLTTRFKATTRVENGWTIVEDVGSYTIWSFSPEGYPAYPALVKNHIDKKGETVYSNMSIKCESTKTACDDLVRTFEALAAQARESMSRT